MVVAFFTLAGFLVMVNTAFGEASALVWILFAAVLLAVWVWAIARFRRLWRDA